LRPRRTNAAAQRCERSAEHQRQREQRKQRERTDNERPFAPAIGKTSGRDIHDNSRDHLDGRQNAELKRGDGRRDRPHAPDDDERVRNLLAEANESVAQQQADAAALLTLVRGHWSIENNLFGVRDTTFGEDACRVRTGQAPQNLAAIRSVAITLLNRIGGSNKAATLRRHAAHPYEAVALIRGSPEN
jgi:predicted transposase YbfD/YdcC